MGNDGIIVKGVSRKQVEGGNGAYKIDRKGEGPGPC